MTIIAFAEQLRVGLMAHALSHCGLSLSARTGWFTSQAVKGAC